MPSNLLTDDVDTLPDAQNFTQEHRNLHIFTSFRKLIVCQERPFDF